MLKRICPNTVVVLLVLLAIGCYEKNEPTEPVQQNWSSIEPLDIPYRQRRQIYEAGNLVSNLSFEEGKSFLDSAMATFHLKAWKKNGDHIQWVDTSTTDYCCSEVSNGRHSIKIARQTSSEKEDQGEGMLSDFIKVIPGKYELTMDIKLSHVRSNMQRLGTKVFDAVYIKLYYFDKNKLPIRDKDDFMTGNINIDNTFKGFPFSNFDQIDSLGWINMKCRSHYSPFYEGYIPDQASYVKIYVGLKGTGNMWFDNVDYRYAKDNFSFLERCRPYFETTYDKYSLLFPKPKYVKKDSLLKLLAIDSTGNKYPVILIPPKADKTTHLAALKLKSALDSIFYKRDTNYFEGISQVKITKKMGSMVAKSSSMIFSIGNTELYGMHRQSLPFDSVAPPQDAYVIKQIGSNPKVVYLAGSSSLACLYACNTTLQLLDGENLAFHGAEIIDYPDFKNRCIILNESDCQEEEDLAKTLELFSDFRFNNIYLNDNLETDNWFLYDNIYNNCLDRLSYFAREYGYDYGVMINPYCHLPISTHVDSLDQETKNKWNQSNNYSFSLLKHKINSALERGISYVCLRTDKYLPHLENEHQYVLYNPIDIKNYFNLSIAHVNLLNNLSMDLEFSKKQVEMEFLPPWHSNRQIDNSKDHAEEYFRNFKYHLNTDINYLWTGYDSKSHYIDKVDLYRYSRFTGLPPVYLDNYYLDSKDVLKDQVLMRYPDKVLLSDIFNSDNFNFPAGLHQDLHQSKYILDFVPKTEIDKIKIALITEYLWNSESFELDSSLWKILYLNFGKKLAKELVYFNKYYMQLNSLYYKSKTLELDKKDEKHFESVNKQINNSLLRIRKYPGGPRLFVELIALTDEIVDKIPLDLE